MPRTATRFENLAELLHDLGGIHPRRVRAWPPPGHATEKDLLHILEKKGRLVELVDGVLVEKITGMKEALLAGHILGLIHAFLSRHDLGLVAPGDGPIRLLVGKVRLPDVSFFSWDQLPTREYPSAPIPNLFPDLAVEVLSKGNTRAEMRRKRMEYFLAGTRLVWYVDPDSRSVEVFTAPDESITLTEKDALDGGDVLPGFRLPLKELFARLPRPRKNGSSRRKST